MLIKMEIQALSKEYTVTIIQEKDITAVIFSKKESALE